MNRIIEASSHRSIKASRLGGKEAGKLGSWEIDGWEVPRLRSQYSHTLDAQERSADFPKSLLCSIHCFARCVRCMDWLLVYEWFDVVICEDWIGEG